MNVEEWKPLVAKSAAYFRRKNRHLDYDDLVQEGWIGVLDALRRFDPTKGAELSTFVTYRIRSRMMDLARYEKTGWPVRSPRKHKGFHVAVEVSDALPIRDERAQRASLGVEAKVTSDKLLKGAPKRGKEVTELYFLEGQLLSDIATRHGRSEAWASLLVSKTLQHGRARLGISA